MRIYTDASAIVSLYDLHDPNHTKTENISKKYLEDDYITSAYSFAEVDCAIFALHKLGLFDKVFTFDKDFKKNKIPILE